MSNEKGKGSFSMPPRASGSQIPPVDAFIAGAVRGDTVAKAQQEAIAPAKGEVGIEDLDHSRRVARQPIRLTDREHKVVEIVIANGGFRSAHEYVLRAVQRQLEADFERITGKKVVLGPED